MAPPPTTSSSDSVSAGGAVTDMPVTNKKTHVSRVPRPRPERPSPLKHLAMRRGSNGDMQQFLRRRSSNASAHRSAMALALANLDAQRAGVKALPEHYRKRARAQYSKSRKQLLVASITSSVLSRLEAARRKAEAEQEAPAAVASGKTATSTVNPTLPTVQEKPLPPTPPGAPVQVQEDASESEDAEYTDVSESSDSGSPCSSQWYSPSASESEDGDDLSDDDADADSEPRKTRAIRNTLRSNKDYDPTRPMIPPPTVASQEQKTAADMLVAGLQQPPVSHGPPYTQVCVAPAPEQGVVQSEQLAPPPHRRSSLVATLSRRFSLAPCQTANTLTTGASPSTFLPPAPLPEHLDQPTAPLRIPVVHPAPIFPTHPAMTDEVPGSLSSNPSPSPSSSSLNTQSKSNGTSERQVRAAALKSILSRRTSNPPLPAHPFPPVPAVAPTSHVHAPGLIADPPIVRSHPPSATVPAAAVAAPAGPHAFPSPPPVGRTTRSPSLPHLFMAPQRSSTFSSPRATAHAQFPTTRSRSMSIPTCLLAGRRKKAPPPPLNLEGLTESFTRDMGKVKQVVRSKSVADLEEERARKEFPRVSEAPEAFRKAEDGDQAVRVIERRPSLVKTIHVRPQKGLVASPESFADESSAAEDLGTSASIAPSAAGESDHSASSATSSTAPLPVSLTRPQAQGNQGAQAAPVPRARHISASMNDLHQSAAVPTGGGIQATLPQRAFHFSGALQVLTDDKSAWLKRHLTFDGRLLTCLAPCHTSSRSTAPHLAPTAAITATATATAEWTLDVSKIVLLALVSKRPTGPSPLTTTSTSSTSSGDAWKLAFTISTAQCDRVLRATSLADLNNWMYVLSRAREMAQLQATVANLMATVREQQGRDVRHSMQDRGVKRPTTDPTSTSMLSPVHVLPQQHQHQPQLSERSSMVVAVKAVSSSLNRPPPIVTSVAGTAHSHMGIREGVRDSMVASIVSTTASPESDLSFRSPAAAVAAVPGRELGARPVPVQMPGGAPQSAQLDLFVAELTKAVDVLDPSASPTRAPGAKVSSALSGEEVNTITRVLAQIDDMVGQIAGLDTFVSATRASWTAATVANQAHGTGWVAADGHAVRLRALARMVSDWPRVIVGASPEKKPQAATTTNTTLKYGATGAVADSAVSVGVVVDATQ